MIKFSRKSFQIKSKNYFRKSENPKIILENLKIQKNPKIILENLKIQKNPKIQNIYHFLIDFFTLAAVLFPLEQSLILLGRIHVLARLSNNTKLVHFHSLLTSKY